MAPRTPPVPPARTLVVLTVVATAIHALLMAGSNVYNVSSVTIGLDSVTDHLQMFFDYASMALEGKVPYRDYLVEYPLLSFPVFLLPRLFAPDLPHYRVAFGLEMLLFDAAAVSMIAREVQVREGLMKVPARLAWYTLFFASLCPLVGGRYDLAPMAVAFASATSWFSGRRGLGGVAAGLGMLMKVFPGAVTAPALAWELSRRKASRGSGTLCFLTTVMVGAACWFALGGDRVVRSLGYHTRRGLEVESVPAGIIYLVGMIRGSETTWAYNFGGFHLGDAWTWRVASLCFPAQAAALGLVMWRFWRSGMTDGVRYAGAAVLAFLVTGKVLSPQFLIWLFPFVATLGGWTGDRARGVFLVACVVTTLIYPVGIFFALLDGHPGAIVVLNFRNALLVGLLGLLLYGPETDVRLAREDRTRILTPPTRLGCQQTDAPDSRPRGGCQPPETVRDDRPWRVDPW